MNLPARAGRLPLLRCALACAMLVALTIGTAGVARSARPATPPHHCQWQRNVVTNTFPRQRTPLPISAYSVRHDTAPPPVNGIARDTGGGQGNPASAPPSRQIIIRSQSGISVTCRPAAAS